MRFLLALPLVVSLCGCWPFTINIKPPVIVGTPEHPGVPATPPATGAEKPKGVAELEKEVATCRDNERKAEAATKDALARLADAKVIAAQHKLYWIMGIAGLAFLLCIAGAIWLSGFAKYFIYGAVASLSTILGCYFLAEWVVPHLNAILIVFTVLIGLAAVAALVLWRYDRKALTQTVAAVEAYKPNMAGYKEHFRQFLDTDVDGWLNWTRSKLGLLPKK
jgi:hypothetical protein